MKNRRTIALIIALLILTTSVVQAFEIIHYKENENNFMFITEAPLAGDNDYYKFTTLAFKASIQGTDYFIHFFPNRSESETVVIDGKNWDRTKWTNLISSEDRNPKDNQSIYDHFRAKYFSNPVDKKAITEYFARADKPIIIDAVITPVVNDIPVSGVIWLPGDAKFPGKVYRSAQEFAKSGIPWSESTKQAVETYYYNIPLMFKPQPVGDPLPVITGINDQGQRNIAPLHTFEEGQPITIDAQDSWFPTELIPLKYEWTISNSDGSNAITTTRSKPGNPFNSNLPVGDHLVKLKTAAVFSLPWDNDASFEIGSSTETQTILRIEESLDPSVVATISVPENVQYGEDEFFKELQATLNVRVNNVEEEDIALMHIKLYDPNDIRNKFVTESPFVNQSMVEKFMVFYDENRLHQFEGYAILTLKNGEKMTSNIATANTWIYKDRLVTNQPPMALLDLANKTVVGNTVRASGSRSFDRDGTIVKYSFSVPSLGLYEDYNDQNYQLIKFHTEGRFEVILGVTDNDGLYDEYRKTIEVTPVPPVISIEKDGYFKENRIVSFEATNHTEYLSAVGDNYTWEIKPLDTNYPASSVRPVTLRGKNIDVLFQKSGRYSVKATGVNRDHGEGFSQTIVYIAEDRPPILKLVTSDTYYRLDNGNATITAFDYAYSIDGDFVDKRKWFYRFDSNNNGSFDDESWNFVKTGLDPDNKVSFKVDKVGRYQIKVESIESFGQPTISSLLTADDYKSCEAIAEIEVDNIKPSVSFNAYFEKDIDISIVTDYEGDELTALQDQLNDFVMDAYDNYLNVNVNYITDKVYVGRYVDPKAENFYFLKDEDAIDMPPGYPVAKWGIKDYYTGITSRIQEYSNGYVAYQAWSSTRPYNSEWGTEEARGTFPARIKSVYGYDQSLLIWLKNGDVYYMGTNSKNQGEDGYSIPTYVLSPTKILSNIVQIEGSQAGETYYLLDDQGKVYAHTRETYFDPYMWMFKNYMNAKPDIRGLFATYKDPYGKVNTGSYNYNTGNGVSLVTGLTDIEYIWSNGGALVARKSDGKWYGFGGGLNGFGLSTGFTNTPPVSVERSQYMDIPAPYTNNVYFDCQNSIRYLKNLTDMSNAIGGIDKIDPNMALANDGKVYSFNETPVLEEGTNYLTVLDSHFTYTLTSEPFKGTAAEEPVGTSLSLMQYTRTWSSYANAWRTFVTQLSRKTTNGGSSKKTWYMNLLMPQVTYDYVINYKTSVGPRELPEGYVYPYDLKLYSAGTRSGKNILLTLPYNGVGFGEDGIWDFKLITIPVNLSMGENTYIRENSYSKRIGYTTPYDGNSTVHYKNEYRNFNEFYPVHHEPSFEVSNSNNGVHVTYSKYQMGWKTYATDINKIEQVSFREDSKKYMVYLAKGDSFKKVEKSLEKFMLENDIITKVAAPSQYINNYSNYSEFMSLHYFSSLHPDSKVYSENDLEGILQDVLRENELTFNEEDGGLYSVVGEDTIELSKFYRDYEEDPKYSDRVFVNHDEDYFENSTGRSILDQRIVVESTLSFDKVGRYPVTYSAIDNPSEDNRFSHYRKESNKLETTIYAHRRPLADFQINYTYDADLKLYGVMFVDHSYDLDHQFLRADKGIEKIECFYKKEGGDWIEGRTATLTVGKYMVRYKVQDVEGAWSHPVTKKIELYEEPLLIEGKIGSQKESFETGAMPVTESFELYDVETTYVKPVKITYGLYKGDVLLGPLKTVTAEEPGKVLRTDTSSGRCWWRTETVIVPGTLADGPYAVKVEAVDLENSLKRATLVFDVGVETPIDLEPEIDDLIFAGQEISIRCWTSAYAEDVRVTIFEGMPYASLLSLSLEEVIEDDISKKMWTGTYVVPETVPSGSYRLKFVGTVYTHPAKHQASYEMVQVISLGIEDVTLTGAWQHWRGQVDIFGKQLADMPYRFLSWEKVYLTVKTLGHPDKVSIRMSPELEAMTYTDSNGKTFDYEDQFGNRVQFPLYCEQVSEDIWQASYILPLAHSTLSWEDNRLKPPYEIIVTAEKNDMTTRYIFDEAHGRGIDITGNTTNLIYAQPVAD